jgi:hypothetical protein
MRVTSLRLALLLAALILAGGCQRLNFEQTKDLAPVTAEWYDFDPPRYDQKVLVTVTPSDGPVSAYLVRSDDLEKVQRALDRKETPPASQVIASKEGKDKAEELTFEATVPAKTPYALLLYATKKRTNVKVKVVGR